MLLCRVSTRFSIAKYVLSSLSIGSGWRKFETFHEYAYSYLLLLTLYIMTPGQAVSLASLELFASTENVAF